MLRGYGSYLTGLALIMTALGTGVLHMKGLIPAEIAITIYGAILPLGTMAIRRAIEDSKVLSTKENDRISAENAEIISRLKALEGKKNDEQESGSPDS